MEALLAKVYAELKYLNKVSSQTDFAEKLNYSKSYLSPLLKQGRPYARQVVSKLEEVFHISPQWLNGATDVDMFGKPVVDITETKSHSVTNTDRTDGVNSDEPNDTPKMLKEMIALHRTQTEVALTLARANEHLSRSKEKDSDSMHIMARSLEHLIADTGRSFQKAS